ncbi:hypothetical protein V5O48_001766 [Marasmius crinis-equi]|uniref:Uncharacterized protein n=1 Tax=Marasmius crinis-equi TaxID=585013 RepID=A0ABR3FXY0_9AGAR
MATSKFTWGNKAKVVAGACLSIALRESHKPESLGDIGLLVHQSHTNMKRVLASILSVLGITLVPSEPQQHLSVLQSHLISMLESSQLQHQLPPTLISELKPLSVRAAEETARSLTDSLARGSATLPFAAAPTACAVLILALEAEARATFTNLSELATFFAARCHVGKGVVMRCYKSVQDELVKWSEELNWLDAYQRSNRGRAKVAKRLLVARALKDLIAWKDDIRRQQLRASDCFTAGAELDEKDDESCLFAAPKDTADDKLTSEGPAKKRRKLNHAVGDAAHFLADPLAGPIPRNPTNIHSIPDDSHAVQAQKSYNGRLNIPDAIHRIPLTQYLLASSAPVRSVKSLPSRLQLLSVARGGSGPHEIRDEELLTDSEWESIQRSSFEMEEMLERWRRDGTLDSMEKAQHQHEYGKKPHRSRKKEQGQGTKNPKPRPKTKRINFDALKQFMDDGENPEMTEFLGIESMGQEDYSEDEESEGGDEDDEDSAIDGSSCEPGGGGDVIDDWHPMSP